MAKSNRAKFAESIIASEEKATKKRVAKQPIKWRKDVAEEDMEATVQFLALIVEKDDVVPILTMIEDRKDEVQYFKAKDILRATGLPLLGEEDPEVEGKLRQIKKRKKLSPIILLRLNGKLEILDGYHRVCACCLTRESVEVASLVVTYNPKHP